MRRFLFLILFIVTEMLLPSQSISDLNGLKPEKNSTVYQIVNSADLDRMMENVEHLVNYGTRYYKHENRREIAFWIKSKFEEYDMENVFIDSFDLVEYDSTYVQYNVIGEINPSRLTENCIVINANYDSYSNNASSVAPGAAYNATGIAAMMELAKVLTTNNFDTNINLKFIASAAGICNGSGIKSYLEEIELVNNIMTVFNLQNFGKVMGDPNILIDEADSDRFDYYKDIILNYVDNLNFYHIPIEPFIQGNCNFSTFTLYLEANSNPWLSYTSNDVLNSISTTHFMDMTKSSIASICYSILGPEPVGDLVIENYGDGTGAKLKWNYSNEYLFFRVKMYDFLGNIYTYTTIDNFYEWTNLSDNNEYKFTVDVINNDGLISCPVSTTTFIGNTPGKIDDLVCDLENGYSILNWSESDCLDVAGYNVYHSMFENYNYTKITDSPLSTNSYTVDTDLDFDFYRVTVVDNCGNESLFSNFVKVRTFDLQDKILILDESNDETQGTQYSPNDDMVDNYYYNIISDVFEGDIDQIDIYEDFILQNKNLTLADLSIYKAIYWYSNSTNGGNKLSESVPIIREYMARGGKCIFTISRPSKVIEDIFLYSTFGCFDDLYETFKIQNTFFNPQSRFNHAVNVSDYPDIFVDSVKTYPTHNFHIRGIESVFPINSGNIIYSYGSDYQTGYQYGEMTGFPVALEYLSDEFNFIFTTFNLYYMEENSSKEFLRKVLGEKFGLAVDVEENKPETFFIKSAYPNPFNPVTTISYHLQELSDVKVSVFNTLGEIVLSEKFNNQNCGLHSYLFNAEKLSSGVYYFNVTVGKTMHTKKIVLIK
ncbi:MAG: T9SS type A sorting domain-containing protein [Candidatus Delongbacteria bacterium]|nr:T9SS type A sorting domain-containing protein [Candidatus Delongbacteria bacterium]MBN2835325.1 T9SS type A sorting domain-containing protein [Candidatus Delongbacteria bacterium]